MDPRGTDPRNHDLSGTALGKLPCDENAPLGEFTIGRRRWTRFALRATLPALRSGGSDPALMALLHRRPMESTSSRRR